MPGSSSSSSSDSSSNNESNISQSEKASILSQESLISRSSTYDSNTSNIEYLWDEDDLECWKMQDELVKETDSSHNDLASSTTVEQKVSSHFFKIMKITLIYY